VVGLERDGPAAKRAARNIGADRVLSSLDQATGPFDCVTFWHSLEHMPQAGQMLDRAVDLLTDDGLLVLSLPDFGGRPARAAGPGWLHLDPPRHLVHFRRAPLIQNIEHRGFHLAAAHNLVPEFSVIDRLCILMNRLGYTPLYPFELIKNGGGSVRIGPAWKRSLGPVIGLALIPAAAALAVRDAALGQGSTFTLFFRRSG
jgi:hypothetical protein